MSRSFLFMLLFVSSFAVSAQPYDTAHIRLAMEYVRTEEFKALLRQHVQEEIKRNINDYPAIRKRKAAYRRQEQENMNHWLMNCFRPDSVYLTPVLSSRWSPTADAMDSLRFRRFDTSQYHVHLSDTGCVAAVPVFLSPSIIELHRFLGQQAGNMKFGYTTITRFQVYGNRIRFLALLGIHHN